MNEENNYYYLQNKITGEIYVADKYLVLFPTTESGFKFREMLSEKENWRVIKCSKHLLDQ